MGFDFKMPEEELWARQVFMGTEEATNSFLQKAATDSSIRGVQVMGAALHNNSPSPFILVVYELNLKAKKEATDGSQPA